MRLKARLLINIFLLSSIFSTVNAQLTSNDEKFITEYMLENKMPGISITLVSDYKITYSKSFGVRDNSSNKNVTNGTLFQAASISKSLTAVLYLRNVQNNKISLDSSINIYLEGWKLKPYKKNRKISTARQLLSHTGGTNLSGFLGYKNNRNKIPDLKMILEGNKHTYFFEPKIWIKYNPNSTFEYSGGGYCVLQKALCDINKEDFNRQMQNEIFDFCSMNSSFFATNLSKSQEQMISIGHKKNGKPIKDNYHVYPQLAAAGLWTTSSDLANFLIQIQKSIQLDSSGLLLSQESTREMLTKPILNDGAISYYGLGFSFKTDSSGNKVTSIWHGGSNWGYTCNMEATIDGKHALVIMCNRNSADLWPIKKKILNRINEAKN